MKKLLRAFSLPILFVIASAQNVMAIGGQATVYVGQTWTYTYSNGSIIVGGSWAVTKGSVVTTSLVGTTYTADINWTTVGSGVVTFLNGNHVVMSTLNVTVQDVPIPPNVSTTYSIANNCGNSVITRNTNPASGVTWYWQTSSTGTSTALGSGTSYTINAPGSVYLRARYNAIPNGWSTSSQSAGTISFKVVPTAAASAQTIFSGGSTSVAITNPNGVSGTTYSWTATNTSAAGASSGTGTPIAQMLTVVDGVTSGSATYTITPSANSCPGTPITAFVTVHSAPSIRSNATHIVTPPVLLSANTTYDTYSWKNGAGTQVGTSPTYSATTGDVYTLTVTKSGSATTSAPFSLTGQFSGLPVNYVVSYDMLVDGVTSSTLLDTQAPENVSQTIQYLDGLGRPTQTISTKASTSHRDMVQPNLYDEFGREYRKYLPYTTTNTSYGWWKDNGNVFDGSKNYTGTALNFYNSSGDRIADDARYFSETVYESSPLNRPLQEFGPGSAWYTNTKAVTHDYKVNVDGNVNPGEEKVINWGITQTTLGGLPVFLVTQSSYWPSNSLDIKVTTDENGHQIREFTDRQGRMLLKKIQYDTVPNTYDDTHWALSYYIYDEFDRLRFVLPPEFNTKITTYNAATTQVQSDMLAAWAFQYTYDERGRKITKQVPGAGRVDMVYDQWDRMVLSQDANQRAANRWAFTKYDFLNRPIISGEFASTNTRSLMVTAVTAFTPRYETVSAGTVGYTLNQTYPPTVSLSDIFKISYYDDYFFKTNLTLGTSYDFLVIGGFSSSFNTLTKGKLTGTKTNILGSSNWLISATYYDDYYRTIQTISDDHLGNKNRISNSYYGITPLVTKSQMNHGSTLTSLAETDYDHIGRPTKTYLTMDGSPLRVITSAMTYNEIGQLVEKNLHSIDNGVTYLQSIDYRHNIRGWIKSINNSSLTNDSTTTNTNNDANDLFGMEINYESAVSVNGSTSNASAQYNGNIAAIQWGTNNLKDPLTQRIFGFTYDPLNRLLQTTYAANNSGTWTANGNQFNEALSYDKNGNILTLNRNSLFGEVTTAIDQLAYVYASGNQLATVTDNSSYWNQTDNNQDYGFNELIHTINTEYTYDGNGNMTSDLNTGITSITYNYLNKPVLVTLNSPTRTLQDTYDASGNKLKKVAISVGTQVAQTDYVGPIQYEGTSSSTLAFMQMSEGRVVKNGSTWNYEYFLKDHLGNNRVVFAYTNQTDEYKATLETASSATEEAQFKNLPATRLQLVTYNHTGKNYLTPTPDRVAETNGYTSKTVGPAKVLQVHTGDVVNSEVYARYTTGTGGSTAIVSNLVAAVTGAYGILGTDAAYTGFNNNLPGISAGLAPYSSVPKAYLIYILFKSDYSTFTIGYQMVSSVAQVGPEKLTTTITVPVAYDNGYLYIYVANESNVAGASSVYFDDMFIKHLKAAQALQVTQANDFYMFGLPINPLGYQKTVTFSNNYKFQKQEHLNDFGLNWDQFKWRNYQASIGRFFNIDPLAEKYVHNSPYAFSENKVVAHIELEGLEAENSLSITISKNELGFKAESEGHPSITMRYDRESHEVKPGETSPSEALPPNTTIRAAPTPRNMLRTPTPKFNGASFNKFMKLIIPLPKINLKPVPVKLNSKLEGNKKEVKQEEKRKDENKSSEKEPSKSK